MAKGYVEMEMVRVEGTWEHIGIVELTRLSSPRAPKCLGDPCIHYSQVIGAASPKHHAI